jgi:two-component system response regulator GlrR
MLLQPSSDRPSRRAHLPQPATRVTGSSAGPAIISRSERMQTLLDEARMLANTDASVLIQGESGSGKELLARFIHQSSPRAAAPFIAINCSAIPEHLLESELFGHVRGAFSGAINAHPGLFEAANGGTLLLDEIGDMPLTLQTKLLRVLQERSVRAVGAMHSRPVDVRILSATHCDLRSARAEGRFREDLYYRIKVVGLHLPSLDERREDIPLLATHFLEDIARRDSKRLRGFSARALQALCLADWPGNIRELQNVIEQVCALSTGTQISLAQVERALHGSSCTRLSYAEAKARFERDYLTQLLSLTGGNVSDAARLAERNRTEFYRLLQRHELDPERFRSKCHSAPGAPG